MRRMKKIHELVQHLINQKDYVTANNLAKIIDVSPRTIYNYLESTDFSNLIHHNEIEKTPNLGIKVSLSNNRKLSILAKIKKMSILPIANNNYDDFTFIMIHLFLSQDYLTYSFIEENIYKSPSSIHNIIQEIEIFVSKFSCELVYLRNQGFKLIGPEQDIRSLFLFTVTNYISVENQITQDSRISTRNETILDSFFFPDEKASLIQLAELSEAAMNNNICENDYNLLLLYLMIIIIRIRNGFISGEEENKQIEESIEFQYAVLLKFHIENKFDINVPKNELYYLTRILMSTRKQVNVIAYSKENKVISQFILLVSKRLNIDLTNDQELTRNLHTHLRPAINRMKQGIPFSNPLLDHIKNDYTEVYLSVLIAIDDLEKMENIYFDSNEIGYICLHIIAAINRPENINSLKTALICKEGLSIEQFLKNIIESYFKEIEIIKVYRTNSLAELDFQNYNLIINSSQFNLDIPNMVSITPSFTDEDFSKLKHFITFTKIENEVNKNYLQKFLLFFQKEIPSQDDFIKKSCSYLFSNRFVTELFAETVFKRQKQSSTYIARGIAVLHGSKEEVIQPAVMIVNLKKEIDWEGYKVKTAIFIISNDTNSSVFSQLLRQIMRIASSDQLTNRLHTCKNVDDVYDLLEEVKLNKI
ncbi:BglG family transcription antiterminator [Vagococcus elongatus]|nr:PTS sugar transporter subunit IIA [Vagococcus elongatus]